MILTLTSLTTVQGSRKSTLCELSRLSVERNVNIKGSDRVHRVTHIIFMYPGQLIWFPVITISLSSTCWLMFWGSSALVLCILTSLFVDRNYRRRDPWPCFALQPFWCRTTRCILCPFVSPQMTAWISELKEIRLTPLSVLVTPQWLMHDGRKGALFLEPAAWRRRSSPDRE